MIALINLLNVNRVQNQRTGRLNHSTPITTGVELSPTAATGRFFFLFEKSARDKDVRKSTCSTVHTLPLCYSQTRSYGH